MAKTKQPQAPAAPYVPTDYERGVLDALDIVRAVTGTVQDAEHQVRRITHDATPALRALLAGTNAAANIAGHVRAEVEKMAMVRLMRQKRVSAEEGGE